MSVLRADARRNLELVLEAASQAFAELGPDVSVDEIARRAGVGHGTVFRRFPTKSALMAAVLGLRLEELAERAEALVAESDPVTAFDEFVWLAADACGRDRAFFEGVPMCEGFAEVADAKQRVHVCAETLLQRAQKAGSVRADVTVDDVSTLIGSAVLAAPAEPEAWRRYVEIILAGLRPPPR
jgi:AcrR family transcriptional regulator